MTGRVVWTGICTVIELLKDRTIAGFFVVGLLMILGGYVVAEMSVVEKVRMYLDTGMGAIFIVSVFITLMAGSNVIDREIRDREVLCTLSKPIPRSAWMLGKAGGFLFTLGLLIFALTLFMFLYVRLRMGLWVPALFVGGLFIFLEMVILSGYTAFFSTFTSQNLTLFFGLLVLFIGHMVDDLKIYWASASFAGRAITKGLFYLIPDLESFLTAPVVHGQAEVPARLIFFLALYSLAYLLTMIALAVIVVNRKEIA
ncbi:MAG: hypothetical protein ABIH66_03895 [bacterium]